LEDELACSFDCDGKHLVVGGLVKDEYCFGTYPQVKY